MASIDRGSHGLVIPRVDTYVPSPEYGFDFDTVGNVIVYDQFGNRKRFYTLYQDTKTILVFVRVSTLC